MNRVESFLFLCRCLSGQVGIREVASESVAWELVVAVASESMMTAALCAAFEEQGLLEVIPGELREYLEMMRDLNRSRNERIRAQVGEVAALLNGIGVEPLVMKGAGHLIAGLYRDPGARVMDDIDLLVPEERAAECYATLVAQGYRPTHTEAELPAGHFHAPGLQREGRQAVVEVHRRSPWPWLGSVVSEVVGLPGGGRARVPDATSALMIAVAHGYVSDRAKQHAVIPLRDLLDACTLAKRRPIDGDRVWRTFRAAGETDALRTHSVTMERLLGEGVPGGSGRPRLEWLYWRLAMAAIENRDRALAVRRVVFGLLRLLDDSANGRRARSSLLSPRGYVRTLQSFRGREGVSRD